MCTDGVEVSEILSQLNISKSPCPDGHDGTSSRVLKLVGPAVANTLAGISNISIESKNVPED